MGCGQSKIHLYPRKNKSKANGKKNGHSENNEADEEEGHNGDEQEKDCTNEKEKIEDEQSMLTENSETPNGEITIPILRRNGPLQQSQEMSTSQQNFFRMLDEKIEQGPDYDSSSETEIALEEARLNALIQHWESASLTASMCSSTSRSLQETPVKNFRPQLRPPFPGSPLSVELQQLQAQQQQLQILKAQHQQMNSPKRDIRPLLLRNLPPQQQPQTAVLPPMAFYSQPPQSYYGEVLHPIQQVPSSNPEPRFPPAISVQRLAPQVQRQLRETQELIKDSCPQLYAAGYGSPGKWQSYHHGAPH